MTLRWRPLRRPDGATIEQAPARNNSWYILVHDPSGTCEVRYASQSSNTRLAVGLSPDAAKREAEAHAARYDTGI